MDNLMTNYWLGDVYEKTVAEVEDLFVDGDDVFDLISDMGIFNHFHLATIEGFRGEDFIKSYGPIEDPSVPV